MKRTRSLHCDLRDERNINTASSVRPRGTEVVEYLQLYSVLQGRKALDVISHTNHSNAFVEPRAWTEMIFSSGFGT